MATLALLRSGAGETLTTGCGEGEEGEGTEQEKEQEDEEVDAKRSKKSITSGAMAASALTQLNEGEGLWEDGEEWNCRGKGQGKCSR